MVWSKAAVARRYARSWLAVDLVSVVPFDVVALALASSGLSFLKLLRVVRLLRVIKLLRIAKSARVVAQLRLSLGWSYATFAIAVMLCATVACIHLIACAYGLVGKVRERESAFRLSTENVPSSAPSPRRVARVGQPDFVGAATTWAVVSFGGLASAPLTRYCAALECAARALARRRPRRVGDRG